MGLVPEWFNKGERPMGNVGQFTQTNMFTNPTYEQQPRAGRLAQALMNPQPNMQQNLQPGMNPMMPNNANMMLNQNPQMQNWNSQYQGN